MALTKGSAISASDINALHTRVLNEIARRSKSGAVGSMSSWTSKAAYTKTPAAGNAIQIEHANKIIEPVNAINTSGMTKVTAGAAITNFSDLSAKLTTFETRSKQTNLTGSDHLCNASCTGLCSTGCHTGCSSCGGSCSNNCSSSCTGDCEDTCSGGCIGDCYNSCDRGCSYCSTSCGTGNCKGLCTNDCATGCSETCAVLAGKV
nr:MAG TPA: Nematocyst outer wall antigen evolution, nematocyst, bridge state [Bacteriophage sp.]